MTHSVILEVTARLVERSRETRAAFLARTKEQADAGKGRVGLTCGNLAHAVAASCSAEKKNILDFTHSNVAMISAYNDMLSAHQPYQYYPELPHAQAKAPSQISRGPGTTGSTAPTNPRNIRK